MRRALSITLLCIGFSGISLSYAEESTTQIVVPKNQASGKADEANGQKTHKAVPMNEFSRKLLESKIRQYNDYFGNNDN